MPLSTPTASSEAEQLLAFLGQQRAAVTNACLGLTDEEARTRVCAGALTLGGLVTHLAYGERSWVARLSGPLASDDPGDEAAMAAYVGSFALVDGQSLEAALADYADAAAGTDAAFRAEPDLARAVALAPAPWLPAAKVTVRWVLLHLIEEVARHAGHADLLREQLDGAGSGPLMAAVEGWPEDGWITPWRRPG